MNRSYVWLLVLAVMLMAGCLEKEERITPGEKAVICAPDGEILYSAWSDSGVVSDLSAQVTGAWLVGEDNGFKAVYYSEKNLTDTVLELNADSPSGGKACLEELTFSKVQEKENKSRFFEDYEPSRDLVQGPQYAVAAKKIEGIDSFTIKKIDRNTGTPYSSVCAGNPYSMAVYASDICLTREEVEAGRVIMIEVVSQC